MFITYPQPNGQVAIVIPCGKVNDAIKDVPRGVEYKIVESVDIDNDFFDAYEFDAETGAKINIEKAKIIQLNKFRASRTSLLAVLDVDFMRAIESGDTILQKEIASKKQVLRDVTSINLPNSLEEIKNVWPKILGAKPLI
jgi:hypothetical protein